MTLAKLAVESHLAAERDSGGQLATLAQGLALLHDANNLSLMQATDLYGATIFFRPDVVVELGRGNGNSTCAFALATHRLGHGRVISLCNSYHWRRESLPKLAGVLPVERVDAREADIVAADWAEIAGEAQRVLVFWDAHGHDIADAVFGGLMPLLAGRQHFVIMHDISDARYSLVEPYNGRALWRGMDNYYAEEGQRQRVVLGWINTIVDQAIPALDFCARNRIELHSADHELNEAGLLQRTGNQHHWAYFSLNEGSGPYTFPTRRPLTEAPAQRPMAVIKSASKWAWWR